MGPIQPTHHSPSGQTQASGQATVTDHRHLHVEGLVKTMIEKISSNLCLEGEQSTAHSPASIAPALGMMLACMENNGDKEKLLGIPRGSLTPELEVEIHQTLGEFSRSHTCSNSMGPDENTPIVNFNFCVSDYPVQDEQYQQILSKHYLAPKLEHNHKYPADISDAYVKEKTNNRIPTLFDGLSAYERSQTRAVLCNVMEVKAVWETLFSPDKTFAGRFMREDGNIIENVLMMDTTDSFQLATFKDFTATSKDFKSVNGEDLKLVVIKPVDSSHTRIKDLDRWTINRLMDQLAQSPKKMVKLTLPKMVIESSDDNLLSKINHALNTDITAEQLSRLGADSNECLSVAQKIKASIDEQGARIVAASNARVFTRGSSGPAPEAFRVNCPSFIVITDGKDNILEATLKCEKFLSTDGPAIITHFDKPTHVEERNYQAHSSRILSSSNPSNIGDSRGKASGQIFKRDSDDPLKFSPTLTSPLSPPKSEEIDNKPDLDALIRSKLNRNGEFNIGRIDTDRRISIQVGSRDQADRLKQEILSSIGEEYAYLVDIWDGSNLCVEVVFEAREKLIKYLIS